MSDSPLEKSRSLTTMDDLGAEIDQGIVGIIKKFNEKGIRTNYSCSGLPSDHFDLSEGELSQDELDQVKSIAINMYVDADMGSIYNTSKFDELFYISDYPTLADVFSREVPVYYYVVMKCGSITSSKIQTIKLILSNMRGPSKNILDWDVFCSDEEKVDLIDRLETQFRVEEYFPLYELEGELYDLIDKYAVKNIQEETIEEVGKDDVVDSDDTSDEENTSDEDSDLGDIDISDIDGQRLAMNIAPPHRLMSINMTNMRPPSVLIRISDEAKERINNASSVEEVENNVQKELDQMESVLADS